MGAAAALDIEVRPPEKRFGKASPKTPTRIYDEFLVPDEYEDVQSENFLENEGAQYASLQVPSNFIPMSSKETLTNSLRWLEREPRKWFAQSSEQGVFEDILESIHNQIMDQDATQEKTVDTLYE